MSTSLPTRTTPGKLTLFGLIKDTFCDSWIFTSSPALWCLFDRSDHAIFEFRIHLTDWRALTYGTQWFHQQCRRLENLKISMLGHYDRRRQWSLVSELCSSFGQLQTIALSIV